MSGLPSIETLVVGMLDGNCYLVKCDDVGHGVIVDPGDEPERIAREVREMSLEPEVILLTHGHIDHTNGARALRKAFRCRVVCHPADKDMVQGREESLWGLERVPCTIDQEVDDGDVVLVGGRRFGVMHTPGHTRGSVCYTLDSWLFTGDTLFRESIGRTDLPGGSDQEMSRSLRERIAVLDGRTVVHPGHGPYTTIDHEKKFNPFL